MQQQSEQAPAMQLPYQGAGVDVTGQGTPMQAADSLPGLAPWPGHPEEQQAAQMHQQQQMPPVQANPAASLPPQVQRAGRKAARAVVEAVAQTPSAQRGDVLLQGIMGSLADLGPYLKAVGVSYAVREAGADDALTAEILTLVQQSGMLPSEIPL